MPNTPDTHRYIDVQMRGGVAVSDTETTIRRGGKVLISEASCPVLENAQRAELYIRAAMDAGAKQGAATLHYRASSDWDFEYIGESEPGFIPEGCETVMMASIFCGETGGALTLCDLPPEGPQADGTHVKTEMSVSVGSDAAPGAHIGDIITRGEDRGEALRAMKYALDAFVIDGVATNIRLLSAILSEDRFERGDIHAAYLDEEFPQPFTGVTLGKGHCRHIAAVCAFMDKQAGCKAGDLRYALSVDGHDFTVELIEESHAVLAAVDEDSDKATVEVELKSDWKPGERVIEIYIDDRLMILQVKPISGGYAVYYRGADLDVRVAPVEAQ